MNDQETVGGIANPTPPKPKVRRKRRKWLAFFRLTTDEVFNLQHLQYRKTSFLTGRNTRTKKLRWFAPWKAVHSYRPLKG